MTYEEIKEKIDEIGKSEFTDDVYGKLTKLLDQLKEVCPHSHLTKINQSSFFPNIYYCDDCEKTFDENKWLELKENAGNVTYLKVEDENYPCAYRMPIVLMS